MKSNLTSTRDRRVVAASDRRSVGRSRPRGRRRAERFKFETNAAETERRGGGEGGDLEKEMRFALPSGLVEVPEVLEEVLPLLLVRDGVLVEDLGHVRGYEGALARARAC